MKKIIRSTIHKITNIRSFQAKKINAFAKNKENLDILEIGSGKQVKGKYPYSFIDSFSQTNNFTLTDIDPKFGHSILDATEPFAKNKHDVILCMNVLEHVYECQKVVDNIHSALKKNGIGVFSLPFIYPLHDEPGDYWRFTEHVIRKMFSSYSEVSIQINGKRQFAYCYYVEAKK